MLNQKKIFAIIGAGPKGLAVAVKAKVLSEFGYEIDQIVLIEKSEVAAHWSGDHGYTNGEMKLGTSPEKDVVFPIETDLGDEILNLKIQQRLSFFSWTSYLINIGKYAEWIDRGRPSPCHKFWCQYLTWVSNHLQPEILIVQAKVDQIEIHGSKWHLNLSKNDKITTMLVDSLMITGPGEIKKDFVHSLDLYQSERIFDLKTFWGLAQQKKLPQKGKLAIVGAGENAASALLAIFEAKLDLEIEIISPKGFIATRAENFYENQFYSAPEKQGWKNLTLKDRFDFIGRTDLGVFSSQAMNLLNEQKQHRIRPGRVFQIHHNEDKVFLSLSYGQTEDQSAYDYVLLASGFDQTLFLKRMLSQKTVKEIESQLKEPLIDENICQLIQFDLSVSGLFPKLYLPTLAGLMQGPGFSNLSSLGRLSDRIFYRSISSQNLLEKGKLYEL